MRAHSRELGTRAPQQAGRFPRTGSRLALSLALTAVVAGGCEEEPRNVGTKPNAAAKNNTERGIIGKRTQDIRNASVELPKGNAKVATTRITAKDPITLQGNAYVSSIGRISQLAIEDAINKFRALNDRYPKDYDEFMTEIIKANGISLPVLPPYQEYSYVEKEHKLVILEYPDRKNQPAQ